MYIEVRVQWTRIQINGETTQPYPHHINQASGVGMPYTSISTFYIIISIIVICIMYIIYYGHLKHWMLLLIEISTTRMLQVTGKSLVPY